MPNDVRLRNVTAADLPAFFEQQRDPEATRMAAFPARDLAAFELHWAKILADDSLLKHTVLYDGEVAGNVVCFALAGQPHVGYWLGREFWGKGIATRALSQFLELVETRPLYARVAMHNVGSRRVLEKCGFRPCGKPETVPDDMGGYFEELLFRLDPPPPALD